MYRLLLLLLVALPAYPSEPLRVAVAANFRHTAAELNTLFESRSRYQTVTSSASTGVLYSQIRHGAPFDIFLAADREAPRRLEEAGLAVPGSRRCYALGRLVLAGPTADTPLATLADPASSLAIANPATAPYGRAAMQVLARGAFTTGASRKLVRGNNVLQAWQYWRTGAVDLALLPAALAPGATEVPPDWYAQLEQQVVLLQRAASKPQAGAYLAFLQDPESRALIDRAGYGACP